MGIDKTLRVRAASSILQFGAAAAVVVASLVPGGRAGAQDVVIIDGRGFGHGVGMAQDGAYWMGKAGRSAAEIITTFYPGTVFGKRGGAIRVPLGSGASVTLSFPGGGKVGTLRVPVGGAATVSVTGDGLRASVAHATKTTAAAPEAPDTGAPAEPPSVGVIGLAYPRAILTGLGILGSLRAQEGSPGAETTTTPSTAAPPTAAQPGEQVSGGPDPAAVVGPQTSTVAPDPATSTPALGAEPTTILAASPDSAATDSASPGSAATRPQPQSAPLPESDDDEPASVDGPSTLSAVGVPTVGFGGRRYRGSIELSNSGSGMRITNVVDVEDYLRGMGEVLRPDWPAAALQAQAIAARTYALRMMGTHGDVCPTQACQVYLGAQAEYPAMDAAVAATRGRVVTYKGSLVATYYSASGGGTIASPEEGFGAGAKTAPYLRAGIYLTGDLQSWTVTMSLSEVARRVGYAGAVSSVAVTRVGPSGRATEVTVYGSAGSRAVSGVAFDRALGLRSTNFTFRGFGRGGADVADAARSFAAAYRPDPRALYPDQMSSPVAPTTAPRVEIDIDPLAAEALPVAGMTSPQGMRDVPAHMGTEEDLRLATADPTGADGSAMDTADPGLPESMLPALSALGATTEPPAATELPPAVVSPTSPSAGGGGDDEGAEGAEPVATPASSDGARSDVGGWAVLAGAGVLLTTGVVVRRGRHHQRRHRRR